MAQNKTSTVKEINTHLFTILAILSLLFTFSSCDKDNNCEPCEDIKTTYPTLEIVNQHGNDFFTITSVSLVGYDFNSVAINWGELQTFVLDKGMSAGYKDINVLTY